MLQEHEDRPISAVVAVDSAISPVKANQDTLASIADLLERCDRMLQETTELPIFAAWLDKITAKKADFEEALKANVDMLLVADLGEEVGILEQEGEQMQISQADFHSFGQRRTELLIELDNKCQELIKAKQFRVLKVLVFLFL